MFARFLRVFTLVLACVTISFAAQAQTNFPFSLPLNLTGVTFDPAIPTPEAVIGHQIGQRHTRPHQVVEYYRELAMRSNRITVQQHALTYEGRRLIHATVTSPANHARLAQIQQANVRLSENPESVSAGDLSNQPVVVYQGFSIHGNEASGTEAAMLYIYYLAAAQGPAIDDLLNNSVLIVDPMFNPDGRDRFVDWVNGNRGRVATTDGQDREHNEPWPFGRTNHYWFDLNRDWMPAQHPESQGRLDIFHAWRPQLLTDHHEMGGNSTFFFQPGIPSRNNPNTPERVFELTGELATYHAARLDGIGSLYYSEESFDDFYYGKGSTYPDINGAIGILFEQGSSRALETETSQGLMTYAFTVRNQFLVALSTSEGAVAMREKFLQHHWDFYRTAGDAARQNPVKGYVIGLDYDRTRAQAFAQMMQRHRVKLHELSRAVTVNGETFSPGEAFIIPMNQSQTRFIDGVMERVTTFEDSLFYDVSAWTMPLAFGLRHAEMRQEVSGYVGAEMGAVTMDGGQLHGGGTPYAYIMEWGRYYAPRALYKLLSAGVEARVMNAEFNVEVNGQVQTFPRGTIIIPGTQRNAHGMLNASALRDLVQQVVTEDHVVVHTTSTGLTPNSPDLGGPSTSVLRKPEIALLSGNGTGMYQVGEAWHLLNERFGFPISLLDVDEVGGADLSRYTKIIMVNGFYGNLNERATNQLKQWIRSGGTLIAAQGGASWAVRNEIGNASFRSTDLDLPQVPYAEVGSQFGAQVLGGAIFAANIDTTHPIAYGYRSQEAIFRNNGTYFEPSERSGVNVAVYTDDPRMSGYIAEEQVPYLAGSAAIMASRYGGGRVVLFADNPNFRAFWWGTNGFFLNAIFFGF